MPHFLSPSWLKKADRLSNGVKKFIAYQRDLMAPQKLTDVQAIQGEFDSALKSKDRATLEGLEPKLVKMCETAVPDYHSSSLKENVEVIIVAVVVALGIRAYYLQPFKIPTASMQPTLNGINAVGLSDEQPLPNPVARAWEFIWNGRNYTEVKVPEEWGETALVKYRQKSKINFFTYTELLFSNGESMTVYAPARQLFGAFDIADQSNAAGIWRTKEMGNAPRMMDEDNADFVPLPRAIQVKGGQVLAKGYIETGDQLLVDKMSYHFRKPSRGEVFVFSTRGIQRIEEQRKTPAGVSQHYIKRLTALPNDNLYVSKGDLYINGKRAEESGTQKVMSRENGYHGYTVPGPEVRDFVQMDANERTRTLEVTLPEKRYMAMGDNSANSFDSRMWGPVAERNLVGPALLVYWPFGQHFGLIR